MQKTIKIAMAQLNTISGDVEYNKNKAIEYIQIAKKKNADLIVFSELFLLSYPIGDILERYPHIALQCEKALVEIAQCCNGVSALVGYPEINKEKTGKPYFNSAACIKDGKIERIIRKSLLPCYSEHNDYRYFEPYGIDKNSRIIELNGIKLGIIICEDGWNDCDFFERNLYKNDPVEEIANEVDGIVCLAASCSRAKKEQLKHNMMKHVSKKYGIKYIYVNQIGANDELVYEGASRMYNEKGDIIALAPYFTEDLFVADFNKGGSVSPLPKGLELTLNSQKEFSLDHEPDLERTYKAIVLAIKDYFSKNGFKRAVLGLSGGLDSSVCAVLCADALGSENVLGISMPSCITSDTSKNDAKELAKNLEINFLEVPIADIQKCTSDKFSSLFEKVNWDGRYKNSYTNDNIQARARSNILFGIANEFDKTLAIATSDKSELYMGYATINGDMSGGYAPISDVVKTKLFALAKWMNKNRKTKNTIPLSVIQKPPGAELAINPETNKPLLAEEALMPYEFLDEVIWRIENLHQSINDMMSQEFLYEKKNKLKKQQKEAWLQKFFKRMSNALYKWYIVPPGPIIDSRSINKAEYKQPIISNINYKGEKL